MKVGIYIPYGQKPGLKDWTELPIYANEKDQEIKDIESSVNLKVL
jgi:hypothetical protein